MKVNWREYCLLITVGVLASSYAWSYFLHNQEDLTIYLEGSRALLEGENPYESTSGRYIYGPSLAWFLSLVSGQDISTIRVFWGSLNILAGLLIAYLISYIQKRGLGKSNILFLFIFLLTSFAFRNNVGQGQAVSWVVVLSLLSVIICKTQSRYSILSPSILLIPVIEIKPYLALSIIIYLIFIRGTRVITYLSGVILAMNILYMFFLKISYLDWIHALQNRSKSVATGYDQSSINSILNVNWNLNATSKFIITLSYYLIILVLLFKYRENVKQNFLPFILVAPCILSPFLHAHDVLFAVAGLLLTVNFEKEITRSQKLSVYFIFALNIGWTSDQLSGGLVMCAAASAGLYLIASGLTRGDLSAITLISIGWVLFLHFAFELSDYSRIQMYNLASVIFAVLVFMHIITKPQNEMSVLSPSRDNLH